MERRPLLLLCAALAALGMLLFDAPRRHWVAAPRYPEMNRSTTTLPCLPRQNVAFAKTHKCASTSVQNMLLRYAHTHNLTVVIPLKDQMFSLTRRFRPDMVAGAPWAAMGYNIFCHHAVFDVSAVARLMPSDTVYVSILRQPVSLFESLYEYDELEEVYHMDIEEYARALKNASLAPKLLKRSNGMGRNQMLYDLGVSPAVFNSPVILKRAIKDIEKHFDFVMIAEFFDHSVVLLRHILCWELDDVVGLTINARMDNYKKNLTEEARKNLEQLNWGDKLLYDHFLARFKETIKEFGEEQLEAEVTELRKRRNQWFKYCVQTTVEAKNLTSYNIWSNKVSGYMLKPNVHNMTCEDLVKPEKYFTFELRQHQLMRSIKNSSAITNYGPAAFKRLVDLKYLKGEELALAKSILTNQYKYKRKFHYYQ